MRTRIIKISSFPKWQPTRYLNFIRKVEWTCSDAFSLALVSGQFCEEKRISRDLHRIFLSMQPIHFNLLCNSLYGIIRVITSPLSAAWLTSVWLILSNHSLFRFRQPPLLTASRLAWLYIPDPNFSSNKQSQQAQHTSDPLFCQQ